MGELRRKLGGLKHLGRQLPISCRKVLAQGFMMGKLIYLIQIWGSAPDLYITKVQSIINNTARCVLNLGRRTSTRHLMDAMGWLNVKELIQLHSPASMWTLTRLQLPVQLSDKITILDDWLLTTSPARLKNYYE